MRPSARSRTACATRLAPAWTGPLLEAMEKVGLADKRAKVIVSSSLDPKKLAKLLGSREVDAYGLIRELARGGVAPAGARAAVL